jgi:hypothetical protein
LFAELDTTSETSLSSTYKEVSLREVSPCLTIEVEERKKERERERERDEIEERETTYFTFMKVGD